MVFSVPLTRKFCSLGSFFQRIIHSVNSFLAKVDINSTTTVSQVTRNLSEPRDQTIMHIDVYADYLSGISPQTTSRAVRALLIRGSSKAVRVDNRYTEAYGPHEVMLNIDGINIYTKTMITCDEDLLESYMLEL